MRYLLQLTTIYMFLHCVLLYQVKVGSPPCPEFWSWEQGWDYCFYLSDADFSWYQAQEHCQRIEAKLAFIPNLKSQKFIRENVVKKGKEYWVRTTSGVKITNKQSTGLAKQTDCWYISKDFQLKKSSCTKGIRGYICMMPVGNACPIQKCQQICVITGHRESHCECFHGFQLMDGRNCADINECNTTNKCDQLCDNTEGDYTCACYDGFEMEGDGNDTCVDQLNVKTEAAINDLGISRPKVIATILIFIPVMCGLIFITITIRLRKMTSRVEESLRLEQMLQKFTEQETIYDFIRHQSFEETNEELNESTV